MQEDLLLGVETVVEVMGQGWQSGQELQLYTFETQFGWVLAEWINFISRSCHCPSTFSLTRSGRTSLFPEADGQGQVRAYIDDIIVYSHQPGRSTLKNHPHHPGHGFTAKKRKCQFVGKSTQFLGTPWKKGRSLPSKPKSLL